MANWQTFWPAPKLPAYQGRDRQPYAHIAPHIRGRVYLMRPAHGDRLALWGMQVINTNTGRVIASDDCTVLEKVVDLADEATAAARAAWFWSFSKKMVK